MKTAAVMLDDADITYDETGHGSSGIVFVPGWCCSRDNFSDILPILAARGWHAVAMDTVGFFGSTTSRDSFTIERAACDLVALVSYLGLTEVVLAGHSGGGAIALEAAHRVRNADVVHVVGIDSLHYLNRYPKQDDAAIEATVASMACDRRAAVEATVHGYWAGNDDRGLIEDTIRQMSSPPQASAIPLFRSVLAWDLDAALSKSPCPVTVLAAATLLEQAAVDRYGERMSIVPVDLGGHFFLRQQPQATAALILQTVGERPQTKPQKKEGQG
ncbi:alpha/beta fold hydrolase [Amycolatopsis pigmentata]|uniref:Alpha/beta fold hydrolase n=1 Tax=Amycolatopsis pigmentata TaxID=450801 RepID=A0ABW5G0W6_9PSEU